jgi:nucleoside-diphosphate-sugar epimerase
MRVFVTGAAGWVGSAVVKDLIAHGHQPIGLARSEANVAALTAAGVPVHRGSLEDVESLVEGAQAADGVVHCAFNHDFSKIVQNCADEKRAIEAMGAALVGTGKMLVITSGTALLSPNVVATEDMVKTPAPGDFPRVALEQTVNAITERGALTSVIRLPPTVHGIGDHGFVHMLVAIARQKGAAAYVGEGANRWPAVNRLDAAPLYRLALEKRVAGARYHAVAEQGIMFRDIAAAIGRGLGLPVVSLSPEQASEHFGWFGHFAGLDAPASSERTAAELGWRPTHPNLLEDLAGPSYFEL